MMELTLLRPLWLLALLPWLWQGWRRRRQTPLLAPAMQAYLLPGQRRHFPWLWLACLPLILALSGPALRQQSQSIPSPALDIWLLDLSRSMLATDLLPDRATRVRVLLQDLLADRAQQEAAHPIALILFAGDAYLAMPPTRDHQALALLLPDLRPAIMPRQGSAPERAVALALKQIPAGQQARLLLITDDLTARQAERIKAVWPCQGSLFCHAQVQARLDVLLANSGQASRLPAAMGGGFGRALPAPDVATLQQLAGDLGGQLQWLQQGAPRFAPLPMSQATGTHQAMDLGPWLLLPLLPLALLARIGTLWLVLVGALLSPPPPCRPARRQRPSRPQPMTIRPGRPSCKSAIRKPPAPLRIPSGRAMPGIGLATTPRRPPPMAGPARPLPTTTGAMPWCNSVSWRPPSRPIWRRWRWSRAIRMRATT